MRWALLLAGIILGTFFVRSASANHNVYLPVAPNTPLMQRIIQTQEYAYCFDSRAASYPAFASQVRDVNDQYAQRVGIRSREVDFSDPACMVKHVMLPEFPCGAGAAACVYYANNPVEIHYQETLAYTDWRSAQGHEEGHGLLGLHEQYKDSGGQISCTNRTDTVMDCGFPFVRYPQPLDVERGCAIIKTSWCGNPQATAEFTDCRTYAGWAPTVSCFWPGLGKWLWLLPLNGKDSLWEYSATVPRWVCSQGCP